MKIAYLHTDIFRIGGTVRTVLNQAEALSARHEVEIVSVFRSRDRPALPCPAEVAVTGLIDRRPRVPAQRGPQKRYPSEEQRRAGLPSAVYPPEEGRSQEYSLLADDRIGRFLRTTDADVVIGTRAGLNVVLARLAPERLVTVGQEHLTYRMYSEPLRSVLRREYPRLNAVVTVTESDAHSYREHLPRTGARVLSIPNCVPEPAVTADGRNRRTILAAGRLVDMKRFDLLIDAFARVAADFPNWQVRIYGRGERRRALQDRIVSLSLEDRVFLPGAHTRMDEVWALGSFAAVTSRDEPFGMTIVEAMRAGLPVLSTDCPHGPREIIRHGEDGLLAANKDVAAIQAGLERLMSDDAARARMAAAALRNSARYDPAAIALRHEELLHSLLGRRTGTAATVPTRPVPPDRGCIATARPDGSCSLAFPSAPAAVVLRAEGRPEIRLPVDPGGRALFAPETAHANGEYTVWRLDGGREAPAAATRIDLRAYPLVPGVSARLRAAVPRRDAQEGLSVMVRGAEHHAEVHRVDVRGEGIAISGTAIGVSGPDPRARLELTERSDPSQRLELPCPVSAGGAFTAEVPLALLARARRASREFWDLCVRTEAGGEYRLGRCLQDLTGWKRAIGYPARTVLAPGCAPARLRPYHTVSDRLAIEAKTAGTGEEEGPLSAAVRGLGVHWAADEPATLLFRGEIDVAGLEPERVALHLAHESGTATAVPVQANPAPLGLVFRARLPLDLRAGGRPLRSGTWRISLAVAGEEGRIALRPGALPAKRTWWRGVRPLYAEAACDPDRGLQVAIAAVRVAAGLRRYRNRVLGAAGVRGVRALLRP